MTQDMGASSKLDRAVVNGAGQAVSAVPASVPSAMIRDLRNKAKDFEYAAQAKRREARELEVRAAELFDAYISFDLLADKMETRLAQAIEAAKAAETGEDTGSVHESAVAESHAPNPEPTP